jgi:hypothetical protein
VLAGRKVIENTPGGAKGVGRRDGCSMALRFAKRWGVKATVDVYTGACQAWWKIEGGDEISQRG